MASSASTHTSPGILHDDLRRQLAVTEGNLRRALDELARVETELLRIRTAAQVEARRGY